MPDSYSDQLGLVRPARNSYYNTWDTPVNLNAVLIDDAVSGITSLTLTGNTAIAITDGADSSGRAAIVVIASSNGAYTVTIDSTSKLYDIHNKSAYVILFKTSGGTGTVALPGVLTRIYCDGTECYRIATSGWGKASSTASSGASVVIDTRVTGEEFTDAMIVLDGISSSNSADLRITFAGVTGTITDSSVLNAANTYSGALYLPNLRADAGVGRLAHHALTSGNLTVGATYNTNNKQFAWALDGGLTTATFSPSTGTWDGSGTFDLYLR